MLRAYLLRAAVLTSVAGLGSGGDAGPPRPAAEGARVEPAAAFADDGSEPARSFYFTRAAYSGTGGRFGGRGGRVGVTDPRGGWAVDHTCGAGFCGWATDYPKGDRQFLTVLRRLTNLDASPAENAVRLDDPALRKYPLIYAVEVGYMDLTDAEVKGLREYLLAGGFLVVDDFWGSYEWASFEDQMRRVFPEYSIVDIPRDHPVFSAFYDIDEILQVPNLGNARLGRTAEQDGNVAYCRGIFDSRGRLMAAINWNTDLGDAWEWAEQPDYPLKYSTFAYQLGVNLVVYALSH
ncbi:MAG: DUF4159 domain-containing protein [Gemmatimonadetes bacterium]|nr:DUF4159 domain-containing protein [Gemmatimonadota bacterium]